jgi:hypothetical protein
MKKYCKPLNQKLIAGKLLNISKKHSEFTTVKENNFNITKADDTYRNNILTKLSQFIFLKEPLRGQSTSPEEIPLIVLKI